MKDKKKRWQKKIEKNIKKLDLKNYEMEEKNMEAKN